MQNVLLLWSGFAAVFGVVVLVNAKSAVHEIEAGLAFLIFTCAFGFAGVMNAINKIRVPNALGEQNWGVPSVAEIEARQTFDETTGLPRESGRLLGKDR